MCVDKRREAAYRDVFTKKQTARDRVKPVRRISVLEKTTNRSGSRFGDSKRISYIDLSCAGAPLSPTKK